MSRLNCKRTILMPIILLFLLAVSLVAVGLSQKFFSGGITSESPPTVPDSRRQATSKELAPSRSWKTFRSEEYGYEFKYPSSHNVITGSSRLHEVIISGTGLESSNSFSNFVLWFFDRDFVRSKQLTFEKFVASRKDVFHRLGKAVEETETIVAGKIPATQITVTEWTYCPDPENYDEQQKCRGSGIFWTREGRIYGLEGTLFGEGNFEQFMSLLEQILSSLRFLE